ncbi:putative protein ecdysoneless [Cocos nucifera]|uniref:Adenosine deaminase domain-containing protein n=1 Tax=Cocos nucifera TaxID=13894 RepID=A0A8K0NF37_COCNU|nr:putative protein ecdysoneless [Cocos nucifera]
MEEVRRNPRIPEDTVFYTIYPDLPPDSPPAEAAATLRSLHLHLIHSVLAPHLRDYIWQHEPLHLSLPSSSAASATATSHCPFCGSPSLPHLHGKTRFGDNLDDEWFVVFLLFEASRAIPSLSARAWDSDGEFLLIEAAFSLPRWLDPDTSTNRIFIRRGDLHIVPRDRFPSNPPLAAALDVVRSEDIDTRASDAVQAAINWRISRYPERARANTHRVRVRVPLPVAQVLKHEPCLISLAVEGFYDRDVDSMKHAARMDKFLRSNGGGIEMVRVSVRMSRAMYAQLVQQNFQAPRCYPMPSRDEGAAAYMEAELGMKIACGFEMMYQERRRAGEEGKGTTWEAFKRSLENSGCFEGLLPGSKEYQRIMDGAFEYYKNSSLSSRTREIMNAPVQRIDEILSMPCSVDDFEGSELPPNGDDSWLYNGEDELNSAILARQKEMEIYEAERKHRKDKRQKHAADGSSSLSDDFNLGDIAETMQAFVQKVSSFEGAEVPPNSLISNQIVLGFAFRSSKAVELDADQFMKIMGSVVGETHEETVCDADFARDTSSSDMDFDDSEDEGGLAEDGNGDTFMQSYSDALNKELNDTTLKRSFIRASQQHSNNSNEGPSNAAKDTDEELTPVDVDVNLVKSFLDSFSSQQGLAGPTSNVLGLMGVKVPPDVKKMELAKVLGGKGVIVFEDVAHVIMKNGRSLPECFKLFDLYHILTTDHETVSRITKEVVEDFAAENVVYLELRTTPKKNEAKGMTKQSYMKAVIDGLRAVDTVDVALANSDTSTDYCLEPLPINDTQGRIKRKRIYIRLLLSIDRRETTASAMETVDLAMELKDAGVVGIDLSGNPVVGEWQTFIPALKHAKQLGLPLTLHCAEIEICLTSNVRTERLHSIDDHHFVDLYNSKHPLALCTDDCGLFSTTLSNEYHLAASTFGLDKGQIFWLARSAIEFVFADNGVKEALRNLFEAAERKLMP